MPHIAHLALVIRDYNEALDFVLVEDSPQPEQGKRRDLVAHRDGR